MQSSVTEFRASASRADRRARALLRDVFGYAEFRGQQEAIIDAALAGHDSLVLMPTGGGKSLCYQIPALVRDGVGLVVSPLIALMEDQVGALREAGVGRGVLEFDAATRTEQNEVIARAAPRQARAAVPRARAAAARRDARRCCARSRSRSSRSTKRTACRNGATTFAPSISA